MLFTPILGRACANFVAALAQNRDRFRADQAGAADDDDLQGLGSLVDGSELQPWRPWIPAGM